MSNSNERLEGITLLGNQSTKYTYQYDPSVLEKFESQFQNRDYMISMNCPEFTHLCPKTSQPDMATIYINYIPGKWCVESKSLKLYLFSFRQHGGFHESCVNTIAQDLDQLLNPKYLEVLGHFLPRGGISIDPYVQIYQKEYQSLAYSRLCSRNWPVTKVDNR